MAKQEAEGALPLDREADRQLEILLAKFRARLVEKADEIIIDGRKGAGNPTKEHFDAAYSRITLPEDGPRNPAQKNIQAALKANRFIEYASYVMAAWLFLLGNFLIVYGVLNPMDLAGRTAALVGGPITAFLLILPWRFAINARRHNIAIGLFGFLLDQVGDNPQLLASLVRRLLNEVATRTPTRR